MYNIHSKKKRGIIVLNVPSKQKIIPLMFLQEISDKTILTIITLFSFHLCCLLIQKHPKRSSACMACGKSQQEKEKGVELAKRWFSTPNFFHSARRSCWAHPHSSPSRKLWRIHNIRIIEVRYDRKSRDLQQSRGPRQQRAANHTKLAILQKKMRLKKYRGRSNCSLLESLLLSDSIKITVLSYLGPGRRGNVHIAHYLGPWSSTCWTRTLYILR